MFFAQYLNGYTVFVPSLKAVRELFSHKRKPVAIGKLRFMTDVMYGRWAHRTGATIVPQRDVRIWQ